jgi:hypothetical protein
MVFAKLKELWSDLPPSGLMGDDLATAGNGTQEQVEDMAAWLCTCFSTGTGRKRNVFGDTKRNKVDSDVEYALKVEKKLYGQKQAGQVWNPHLVPKLIQNVSFKQSKTDECLFNKSKAVCVLYTDSSILVWPTSSSRLQRPVWTSRKRKWPRGFSWGKHHKDSRGRFSSVATTVNWADPNRSKPSRRRRQDLRLVGTVYSSVIRIPLVREARSAFSLQKCHQKLEAELSGKEYSFWYWVYTLFINLLTFLSALR